MIANFTLRFLRYLSFWTTGCVVFLQWRLMTLSTHDYGHNNSQLSRPSTIDTPSILARRIPESHPKSDHRHVVSIIHIFLEIENCQS
jgi:hypothetical protein